MQPDSKPLNNGINAALGSLLGFAAPLSAAALAEKLVPGQPLALAALVVLSSAATLFLAMRRVVPPAWLVGATTRHGLSMCAAAVLGVAALAVAL
ncbi:hypothetical protein EON68_01795 [archaeon]|nr:MAG: hypothetical protein EON68_01795 [archaeon]